MLSKAAIIRNIYNDVSASAVAKIALCDADYVHHVRWRASNPTAWAAIKKRNLNRRGVGPGQQKTAFTEEIRAQAIELRNSGLSQGSVAKTLGLSLGQVAGIMHRHRKALEAQS